MLVLGIDPGTASTGFGLIRVEGRRLRLLRAGVFRTAPGATLPRRLQRVCDGLEALLEETRPHHVALESLFVARNARSALTLAHLRGALLLTVARHGLDVTEYAPMTVKKAVTGRGMAAKDQVRGMVRRLLDASAAPLALDASDALAVAICHAHTAAGDAARRRVRG